ncbi:hypothetical protein FISHEDRAFT_61251 [Fistulina hepatica ATCC 64428]|uniref:DNA mismatch repair protein MSH3 n=1 Tax=Fistulina hepatica ATCC 64428 TaxID=1128425 RepID=A0A0D7A3B4_9AGAR|nr:hypothetical protein FISHEDRAFT_61251 [Fistulina hepatica ATCC 64428]
MTAASTRHEGNYVVALLESRGVAREIGMAALDKDTGHVMLVQIADSSQAYVKTLHQLHQHRPSLVLVPDTFVASVDPAGPGGNGAACNSALVETIHDEFPGVAVEVVQRKYWNEAGGFDFVNQLCVEDQERAGTLLTVATKYYALSAASALFKHAELKLNTRYAAGSLRIRYAPVDGTMLIDPDTARNLELVSNLAHGKKSQHSLFGVMNHTYTAMASRLLRVNILAPLTIPKSIEARLDVIEELIQNEDRFTSVRDALKAFNRMDFDKLIVSLSSSEARVTNSVKPAAARVAQMLSLRNVVENIPALRSALEGSRSQLLNIIHELISDERIAKIEELINRHLNEEGAPAKGGIAAVNARVYAVRANCNRLLDVARETYKEDVGDILQLSHNLADTHALPIVPVYQDDGFVFTLKKDEIQATLPRGFINVGLKKGKWVFSSIELKKMNARMKDALDETLILSDKIIQDLVAEIIVDAGALYKASEAVALLDMLWSFAHLSIVRSYIRPECTGTLAVKSGRHPILETVQAAGTVVPNDVYCDDSSLFQIIHGPNMSGKSTYLRQTGLLTIMAMCGCYVPAEYASFRLHDALLTRLSNDDDIEKSLSTFASEMATSAMILGLATPKTLVLIDELGRGTSPREGVGISHAIAEELIKRKSFVFFATHFGELSTTLSRQLSVINLHLSVQRTRQSASNFGMSFQYKIVDGSPDNDSHYGRPLMCFNLDKGLDLARLADFPEDVLRESRRVAMKLADLQTRHEQNSESNKIAKRRKALLKLKTQLTQAFEHSALPDPELLEYVSRFQTDFARAFLSA